jgi:hypothetical protein
LTVSLKLLIQRPERRSTQQDRLSIHRLTKNVQERPPWPDSAVFTPHLLPVRLAVMALLRGPWSAIFKACSPWYASSSPRGPCGYESWPTESRPGHAHNQAQYQSSGNGRASCSSQGPRLCYEAWSTEYHLTGCVGLQLHEDRFQRPPHLYHDRRKLEESLKRASVALVRAGWRRGQVVL